MSNKLKKKRRFFLLVLFWMDGTIFISWIDRTVFWETTNWPNGNRSEWIIMAFFPLLHILYGQIESSKNIHTVETCFCIHCIIMIIVIQNRCFDFENIVLFIWTGSKCCSIINFVAKKRKFCNINARIELVINYNSNRNKKKSRSRKKSQMINYIKTVEFQYFEEVEVYEKDEIKVSVSCSTIKISTACVSIIWSLHKLPNIHTFYAGSAP